jgi:hypothetical protein
MYCLPFPHSMRFFIQKLNLNWQPMLAIAMGVLGTEQIFFSPDRSDISQK